jgi:hypothetical protein
MQGAVPKKQSCHASNVLQQKSKLPPLLSVDDDGKPSKLVEASVKRQEYPPIIQVATDKFCAFQSCRKINKYLFCSWSAGTYSVESQNGVLLFNRVS